MFQAHILWNEIENNVIKIHLYKRFKFDAWRRPKDVTLWTKFLQNFKDKQQLSFKYFMQHIWWVSLKQYNSNSFCIMPELTSWGRPKKFTTHTSFTTQLGCFLDVSPKFMRTNPVFSSFNKFYAKIETVFYVSFYKFTYISICLPTVNIKKTTI